MKQESFVKPLQAGARVWPPLGGSLELIYLGSGLEAALVLGPDRVRGRGGRGQGWGWRCVSVCAWGTICKRDKVKIALGVIKV